MLDHLWWHRSAEARSRHRHHIIGWQWLQYRDRSAAEHRFGLPTQLVGTHGRDDGYSCSIQSIHEVVADRECFEIGPMQILEHDECRAVAGQPSEDSNDRFA